MKLNACGYYVLIEIPAKEEQESAIYIPEDIKDSEIESSDIGYVRSIGPSAFGGMAAIDGTNATERAEQWGVKVGNKVEFRRYDGKRPSTEGYGNHRFILDQEIITVKEE